MPASRIAVAVREGDGSHMPHLTLPTTSVRSSYLQGETEIALEEGPSTT
jgi:hypothetical protein